MKKRTTPQKAESCALSKRQFTGTDNPRQLRALTVLLRRPLLREEVDRIAGCSNGPELVADLRRQGLGKEHLSCERIHFIDRDGVTCHPGVYSLSEQGRRMVNTWLARRKRTAHAERA